ncbi:hypothetical protein KAR48_18470 [bacterium]|nr:hypothetical protein [bacterium]
METALAIPQNLLSTFNAVVIAAICVDYPLFIDLFAFNTTEEGLKAISGDFNGFAVLRSTNGAGRALIEEFSNLFLKDYNKKWPMHKRGLYILKFRYVMALLAQDDIFKTLSIKDKNKIRSILVDQYQPLIKNKISGIFQNPEYIWLLSKLSASKAAVSYYGKTVYTPRNNPVYGAATNEEYDNREEATAAWCSTYTNTSQALLMHR